jgi:hypothetical protein
MDRRAKVELFEQIRREYELGVGTVNGVATRFGVHRRTVRQALASAVPRSRLARPSRWRSRSVPGNATRTVSRSINHRQTWRPGDHFAEASATPGLALRSDHRPQGTRSQARQGRRGKHLDVPLVPGQDASILLCSGNASMRSDGWASVAWIMQ